MSWSALLDCIRRRCGADVAHVFDELGRQKFGGDRLYIPSHKRIDPETAAEAVVQAPDVRTAARQLGVHRATVYRRLAVRRIR